MSRVAHVIAVSVVAVALGAASADAPRLDPGNWRVRVSSITNGVADPAQDSVVCLGDELKDLAAYFALEFEGAAARCTRKRLRSGDPKVILHRLRCTGTGFTYEAEGRVTIVSPTRFTLTMRSLAKTAKETGIVSAEGQGDHLGACK